MYFLGVGLISGGIVHMPIEPLRYSIILAIGSAIFITAAFLNEIYIEKKKMGVTQILKLLVYSFILSLGVGMIGGGIQHFSDLGRYAVFLIPTGIVLSFVSYILKNGIVVPKKQAFNISLILVLFLSPLTLGLDWYVGSNNNSASASGHGHSDSGDSHGDSDSGHDDSSTKEEDSHSDSEDGHSDSDSGHDDSSTKEEDGHSDSEESHDDSDSGHDDSSTKEEDGHSDSEDSHGDSDSGHDDSSTKEEDGHSDSEDSHGDSEGGHDDSANEEEAGGHGHGGPVKEEPPNIKVLSAFGALNGGFVLIGLFLKLKNRRKGLNNE
jgi:hypothetical protein